MSNHMFEEAKPVTLNWEEARCVIMRMLDDINDNLWNAFLEWKQQNPTLDQQDKPLRDNNPYK